MPLTMPIHIIDFTYELRSSISLVDREVSNEASILVIRYPLPYTNGYVINGAFLAPEVSPRDDEHGFRIHEQAYPDREIVPAPSLALAISGGGLGCFTQQVPAG